MLTSVYTAAEMGVSTIKRCLGRRSSARVIVVGKTAPTAAAAAVPGSGLSDLHCRSRCRPECYLITSSEASPQTNESCGACTWYTFPTAPFGKRLWRGRTTQLERLMNANITR